MNLDITDTIKFEGFVKKFNQLEIGVDTRKVFGKNVSELLDYLLQESENSVGKSVASVTKEDKLSS